MSDPIPATMRAAWYERTGAARDVLTVGTMPVPVPAAGEVLVRVATSGVNPSDVKSRAGKLRPMAFARVVPHSDGAGTIVATGAGVDAARIGARVWLSNAQFGRPFGTAAEYVAVPDERAVRLPPSTDFAAGACLGIPAMTAYHGVMMDGPVAGKTLLVAGGAGAVAHYAIQFAKAGGARVLATVSSAEKAAYARAAGADVTIDYRTGSVEDAVKAATNGRGVDRILELDLTKNVAYYPNVLADHGIAAVYGSNGAGVDVPFAPFLMKSLSLRFYLVYLLTPDELRVTVDALTAMLEAGSLQHGIGKRFTLDQIAAAHEAVENGTIGNVIIEL